MNNGEENAEEAEKEAEIKTEDISLPSKEDENSVDAAKAARKALYTSDEDLRKLCEANGISENKFANSPAKLVHLDIFLIGSLEMMAKFSYFPFLKSICVLKLPNLDRIQGLDTMEHLESLWITECKIQEMGGFYGCPQLLNLHLSSNCLTKIQALNNLQNLQVLWLNDNRLTSLDGLSSLFNLRVLWVCRNLISRIDETLANCQSLEELNLSDNQIGCFKQILNLAHCKSLRSLSLSDPHFGDNPVCALCNYETYVTFHLTQLTSLDMMVITDESKSMSQAIYLKKKMYYNMRTKMAKRHASTVQSKAQGMLDQNRTSVAPLINRLQREYKAVSSKLDEWGFLGTTHDDDNISIEQYQAKEKRCKAAIEEIRNLMSALESLKASFSQRVQDMCVNSVARLMVEFDTGGNVRLEEGTPSDVWFTSCIDLCHNRYDASKAHRPYDIHRIDVKRVLRVHNRFMRYRMENFLLGMQHSSSASSEQNSARGKDDPGEIRRNMEYLFYLGEDMTHLAQNWPFQICEEGFSPCPTFGVALSSAIPRPSLSKLQESTTELWPTGQALIVKVYVGNNLHLRASDGNLDAQIANAIADGYQTVSIGEGTGMKHKWYVLDQALLLPEYIVDFDYVLNLEEEMYDSSEIAAGWEQVESTLIPRSGNKQPKELWLCKELVDMWPYIPLLKRFYKQVKYVAADTAEGGQMEMRIQESLSLEPVVTSKPTLFMLTKESLMFFSDVKDPSKVVYLNLHGQEIRKLEKLSYFENLERLVLSFNELTSFSGLGGALDSPNLTFLDVSFNMIQSINDLEADCTPEGLTGLKTLLLNNNCLEKSNLSHLDKLAKYIPRLTSLDMRDNSICQARSYRASVLRSFEHLVRMDGADIAYNEKETVKQRATVTNKLIYSAWLHASTFSSKTREQSSSGRNNSCSSELPELDDWMDDVDKLDLSNKEIQVISNLENFKHLKKISFAKNNISTIQGLNNNALLEEINFEGNEISLISNLQDNIRLRRLDLGYNQLCTIENLIALTCLSQLSLESNQIESLEGLSDLECLMELYIGNNRISSINQIHQLKVLPKLIIVDLSGNPVCSEQDYRLYTLYYLRRLKVLDGLSIHTSEILDAKEKYSGRLTDQILTDLLGHTSFHVVRELELLNQKIRDVSVLHELGFVGLVEVTLTRNLLQRFSGMARLPALEVLCLNENIIECMDRMNDKDIGEISQDESIFPSLKVLKLAGNKIMDINTLELGRMPSLLHLDLQDNNITQLTGLNRCVGLKELILDRNKIRQLQEHSLMGLIHLRKLRMQENGLKQLSNFLALPSLRYLNLASNRIADLSELDKLAQISGLADITLVNNPIARKIAYKPSLLFLFNNLQYIDGEQVEGIERERAELMFLSNDKPFMNYGSDMKTSNFVAFQQNTQQGMGPGAVKVPVKLTSVNFETLSVHGDDFGMGIPLDGRGQYFPPPGKRR